jgi:hypothetical protein
VQDGGSSVRQIGIGLDGQCHLIGGRLAPSVARDVPAVVDRSKLSRMKLTLLEQEGNEVGWPGALRQVPGSAVLGENIGELTSRVDLGRRSTEEPENMVFREKKSAWPGHLSSLDLARHTEPAGLPTIII